MHDYCILYWFESLLVSFFLTVTYLILYVPVTCMSLFYPLFISYHFWSLISVLYLVWLYYFIFLYLPCYFVPSLLSFSMYFYVWSCVWHHCFILYWFAIASSFSFLPVTYLIVYVPLTCISLFYPFFYFLSLMVPDICPLYCMVLLFSLSLSFLLLVPSHLCFLYIAWS